MSTPFSRGGWSRACPSPRDPGRANSATHTPVPAERPRPRNRDRLAVTCAGSRGAGTGVRGWKVMKGRAAGRRDAAQAWYTSRAPGRQSNRTGTRAIFRLGIERTYTAQERLGQVCGRCGVQLRNCRSDKRYCDDCQLDRNRKRAAEQSRRLRIEKRRSNSRPQVPLRRSRRLRRQPEDQ
jgi:hypothetical protein